MLRSGHSGLITTLLILFVLVLSLSVLPSMTAAEEAKSEGDPPREESIVGGKPVRDGQYGFVTALIDKSSPGNDRERQFCGGTLIDRDSVLTAAHCVDGRSAGSFKVVVGRTVLSSGQGVTRDVSQVRRHPGFRGVEVNSKFDAAIVNLRKPVTNTAPIRISGPSNNDLETPGRELFIAGWGNTVAQPPSGGAGSNYPDRMRQAVVPVVSDSRTKASYDRPNVPPQLRFYPALMVGAGKTGRDTCQGDSGGPLFSKNPDRIQVGITSYGAGCGASGYPGVYTEVNSPRIRSFILEAS